jgi:hypothetical protein
MYCIKDYNYTLKGIFLSPEMSLIQINLFECKNTTKKKCKPKTVIDELLLGAYFSFSYTEISINPTNFENPNQLILGDGYTALSNKYFKEVDIYLADVLLQLIMELFLLTSRKKIIYKQIILKRQWTFESQNFF